LTNDSPQQRVDEELFADDDVDSYSEEIFEYDADEYNSEPRHSTSSRFTEDNSSSRATSSYDDYSDDDDQSEYTSSSPTQTNIREQTAVQDNSLPQPGFLQRTSGMIRSFGDRLFGGAQRSTSAESEVTVDDPSETVNISDREQNRSRFSVDHEFQSVEPDPVDNSQPSGYRESDDQIPPDSVTEKPKRKKRRNADLEIAEQRVESNLPRLRSGKSGRP
jgi:hypothetical protein